ncbi:MAG TPA: DUF2252 domain-containing protein [Patescibacteria group bacterium]|nr:DUF2252 domain-containing protein [Patescibacteria group bacterium]
MPPTVHATWKPAADRPDPIALLEEQAKTRVPALVPVRYGRMAVSPFTFFRGAALPMAADLAPAPTSGFIVQLAGDAHLSNFGLFASPERNLLFDMNDFDETHRGPWEWDLKRLAASIVVAARSRGFDAHQAAHAVHATVHSYRSRMAEYAAMRAIDIYYARVDATAIAAYVDKRARPYLETTVRSAAHHDALHELPKLTAVGADGLRRIVDHPPTIYHDPQVSSPIEASVLTAYRATLQEDRRDLLDRYQLVDGAIKVVGVGSVGLAAFAALFEGGDEDDPLFLQVKQAEASVLERFLGPSPYASHGERVVAGQRRLQAASDVMLGWAVGPMGRHLYVRQLQDAKASAVVEVMTIDDLATWGQLCGWGLARGHARTGEPAAIAAYLGADNAIDHALADFGAAYADQTEKDHAALLAAIKSGRVAAEMNV